MEEKKWIFCPVCDSKTRIQICEETEIRYFPLFCPKCKKETLIDVERQKVTVVKILE